MPNNLFRRMKTKFKTSFVLAFSLFCTFSLFSQVKAKFGKIDQKNLGVSSCPIDTSADAYYLFDIGESRILFDRTGRNDWQVETRRHVRIKVLNQNGLEWGDVEIPLYRSGTREEKALAIKAMTYNMVDGSVEKIKLSNKDIFREEVDKNHITVKFAIPGVKAGSIIEYQYTVLSDFVYQLDDWQFQSSIPVMWSETSVVIPEYFQYNKTFKGYDFGELVLNEQKNISDAIELGGGQRVPCESKVYQWGSKNVPAFKLEAYSTTPRNYVSRIEFELASFQIPGQTSQVFNESWEGINSKLLADEDFGRQLNRQGLVKDQVDRLTSTLDKASEKITSIFEYVKETIAWDGNYSMLMKGTLKQALNNQKGNSAEVNFVLINMLRAAGIEAHPVLVSTRSHGYVNPVHPSMAQFNHVIAAAEFEGQYLLLDASQSFLPATILPPNDLNQRGQLLHPDGPTWVDLQASSKYRKITQAALALSEDGIVSGTVKNVYQDYGAYSLRKAIQAAGGEEEYFKEMQTENEGLEISEYSFKDLSNVYERVTGEYQVEIAEKAIDAGEMMYLSPMLIYGMEENPFKLEERKYPVDYSYPIEQTYSFQISLPEGFLIEEVPEAVNWSLPEKNAQFSFGVNVVNDQLFQVTSRFKINKSLFLPEEYIALKEFYSLIVDKHAAQIVLKKKTQDLSKQALILSLGLPLMGKII